MKIFTYEDTPGIDVDLSTKQGTQWKIVAMQNMHTPQ